MYAQQVERRQFIQTMAAGAPLLLDGRIDFSGGQDAWARVRDYFLIPRDRIYLNVGTLGAQPRPVVHAVIDATRRVAESVPAGINWEKIKQGTAQLLDCDAEGLAFPRNTTEAMNFIASGLDYRAGDHIVTTNHEHIGGLCCWQLVAARQQLELTQVPLAAAPTDPQQVFEQIRRALTPRTRVVSVSHVNFTTGFTMPVREIVQLCRERGIISVIDGAHPPGLMPVSLREIDPDFYAGSPHKWLLAPQGIGLLWMKQEWRARLWPSVASGDWDRKELGAQRFNHLGTMDESRYAGYEAALAFYRLLDPARVYARIEELRQHLFERLERIPGIQLATPRRNSAGMVAFRLAHISALELQKKLSAHNIRTRVIGEYDYGFMRLSPHVYNSVGELERVIQLMGEA
ncbi:MAG TPA: aminotransferase class V-fold PLP-dependent enzyme [Longimicrobiales bacterium]